MGSFLRGGEESLVEISQVGLRGSLFEMGLSSKRGLLDKVKGELIGERRY